MIPQDDPDLTAYLNEFLKPNKPAQQNNTFWFSILKNPGKPEGHTPIQTQILKEMIDFRDKKNSICKRAQTLETNFSNDLVGLTQY